MSTDGLLAPAGIAVAVVLLLILLFSLLGRSRRRAARSSRLASAALSGALPVVANDPSTPHPAPISLENRPVSRKLITNVKVFDGSGSSLFAGEVLIEGDRIVQVGKPNELGRTGPNLEVVDGGGHTLIPGLVEGHGHLSWPSAIDRFIPQLELPPEEQLLATAHNAKVLLDSGFTSVHSAGALGERIEIVVRDQIGLGWLEGPRLRAATIESSPPGAEGAPESRMTLGRGPANMRAFVKHAASLGADSIKLVLSGEDALLPGSSQNILYTEEEVKAACDQARESGIWVVAHTQASESIKMALRNGVRVLNHCTYADAEAVDMLVAAKDRIFVAPAIGVIVATLEATPPPHIDMGPMKEAAKPVIELSSKLIPELHRRGVRIVTGGDYGFPFNPNGANARDLQHFVDLFGYTPTEALVASTRLGGELMDMQVGQIRAGYFADLLLVDGDPTANASVLQDRNKLLMIMKGGQYHKRPPASATTGAKREMAPH